MQIHIEIQICLETISVSYMRAWFRVWNRYGLSCILRKSPKKTFFTDSVPTILDGDTLGSSQPESETSSEEI